VIALALSDATRNALFRLTSIVRSHSSSENVEDRLGKNVPACQSTMSIGPYFSRTAVTKRCTSDDRIRSAFTQLTAEVEIPSLVRVFVAWLLRQYRSPKHERRAQPSLLQSLFQDHLGRPKSRHAYSEANSLQSSPYCHLHKGGEPGFQPVAAFSSGALSNLSVPIDHLAYFFDRHWSGKPTTIL